MMHTSNRHAVGWDSEYDDHLDDVDIREGGEDWGEWDEEQHVYDDRTEAGAFPSGKANGAAADMEDATDATEQSSDTASADGKKGRKWGRWIAAFLILAVIVGAAVGGTMAARSNTSGGTTQQTESAGRTEDGIVDSSPEPPTLSPTPEPSPPLPDTGTSWPTVGESPTDPAIDDDLQEDDELPISDAVRCVKKNSKPYALEVANYSDQGDVIVQPSTMLTITKTGPQGTASLVYEGLVKDILDRSEAGDPIYLCLRSRMCYTASLSEDMQDGVEWSVRPYYKEDKMIARGFEDQCDFIAPGRPDPICTTTCSV